MLLPSSFAPVKQNVSAKQLYRRFLQHLQLLPDPHIWSVGVPTFRQLLQESDRISANGNRIEDTPPTETSKAALNRVTRWRQDKALRRAEKALDRLRAAVACHPHALTRLIEESYGQRGVTRHVKLRSIALAFRSTPYVDHLPPPLLPLRPAPAAPSEAQPRARKLTPPCRLRAQIRRSIERDWDSIKPPLLISIEAQTATATERPDLRTSFEFNQTSTINNLRLLSGFSGNSAIQLNKLNLEFLPRHIKRIFPSKRQIGLREQPLFPPRPKATRQNPNIWGPPRRLDSRLLRRTYRRFWDNLVWVRPIGRIDEQSKWKICSYEEMLNWTTGKKPNDEQTLPDQRKSKKRRASIQDSMVIEKHSWSSATNLDSKWVGTG